LTDTPIIDKNGPDDLPVPPSAAAVDMRKVLAEEGLRCYPAERLAEDVLRGVDRNKAIIVAPKSARLVALIARLAPGMMARQALVNTRRFRDLARTRDSAESDPPAIHGEQRP
jgi:hypothetical protein